MQEQFQKQLHILFCWFWGQWNGHYPVHMRSKG